MVGWRVGIKNHREFGYHVMLIFLSISAPPPLLLKSLRFVKYDEKSDIEDLYNSMQLIYKQKLITLLRSPLLA